MNSLRRLVFQGKEKLDDSSRLDVVEIARVPDMLPSLFPSWSGLRNFQHPGYHKPVVGDKRNINTMN